MAACGWCPSGRLFEAAACATPILSDWWEGLGEFFVPGREVLVVDSAEDVLNALELSDRELSMIGAAACERALNDHTADCRATELVQLLSSVHERAFADSPQEA
jgi:spore maturation protein CgeB